MAVKIRLKRLGKIRSPHYRIVVADSRTKRDGRAIEEIGKYHPKNDPSVIEVDMPGKGRRLHRDQGGSLGRLDGPGVGIRLDREAFEGTKPEPDFDDILGHDATPSVWPLTAGTRSTTGSARRPAIR